MADAVLSKPVPADMEITPERALKIKQALIRQYEDQFGVEVISWTEKKREENPAPAWAGADRQAAKDDVSNRQQKKQVPQPAEAWNLQTIDDTPACMCLMSYYKGTRRDGQVENLQNIEKIDINSEKKIFAQHGRSGGLSSWTEGRKQYGR